MTNSLNSDIILGYDGRGRGSETENKVSEYSMGEGSEDCREYPPYEDWIRQEAAMALGEIEDVYGFNQMANPAVSSVSPYVMAALAKIVKESDIKEMSFVFPASVTIRHALVNRNASFCDLAARLGLAEFGISCEIAHDDNFIKGSHSSSFGDWTVQGPRGILDLSALLFPLLLRNCIHPHLSAELTHAPPHRKFHSAWAPKQATASG